MFLFSLWSLIGHYSNSRGSSSMPMGCSNRRTHHVWMAASVKVKSAASWLGQTDTWSGC